jgi:hypothetical protein
MCAFHPRQGELQRMDLPDHSPALEQRPPRIRHALAARIGVDRVEVEVGEDDIEPRDELCPAEEPVALQPVAHRSGDLQVEPVEARDTVGRRKVGRVRAVAALQLVLDRL